MTGRGAHRTGTFVLSLMMAAIGVALIVEAVAGGGSVISPRLLLGVLFIAAGAGRLYLEIGRGRGHERPRRPGWPWRGARRGQPWRARCALAHDAAAEHRLAGPVHVVYSSLASAIYFSLGVIAGHALGLTPVVFLVAALLFTLTAMTYAEGASLHQDRGGSTVFARYAFNELVSFIAGWAIVLDYIILIAVTAFSATQYLRVFWHPLGHRGEALGLALAFIALVVLSNIRGFGGRRARRVGMLVAGDLLLQGFIVVLGLVLFFSPHTLLSPIHLGSAPSWSGLVFALTSP
jgi:hypothetical protein